MSLLLSSTGCDRATAYTTSHKIVRYDGRLYIGWLDQPEAEGELFPIRLGIVDERTRTLEKVLTLGKSYDNHCGPALALDPQGRLHVMLGAHHHPLLHRWSATPDDLASWSEPIALGPFATYPSLISDREGDLHLLHRHMDDRWQLWYRRKPAGKQWEPWVVIAVSPLPGYNHFMQSLSLGPDGSLHLLFQFAYTDTGVSADVRGRSVVYLTSEDGGSSWFNEGQRCTFPLTIETARPLYQSGERDLSIGNHLVDEQNRPWIYWVASDAPGGCLVRRCGDRWEEVDTGLKSFGFTSARDTLLSRDASGAIHLVLATHRNEASCGWHDPAHEIFHSIITPSGQAASFTQLTETDSARANWLPSVEQWDWARPDSCCSEGPAIIYTRGNTKGRGHNRDRSLAEVYLAPPVSERE